MFVNTLVAEDLQNPTGSEKATSNPGWQEIREAIQKLDGNIATLVMLEAGEEAHMGIGGGDNFYVVYSTADNNTFFNLVDPTGTEEEVVTLVVGGQQAQYSRKEVVNLATALTAAEEYARNGNLAENLTWQIQS